MSRARHVLDRHRVRRLVPPPELRLRLLSVPAASAQARRALSVFADSMPAEQLSDLRLIVTELVTNSVKYGPGNPIAVTVARDDEGTVSGEVADGGAGGVRMRRGFDPAGGGLGLQIVDALASHWGVRARSSHVWFELAIS
jgi:two-component sensor histidine kinase